MLPRAICCRPAKEASYCNGCHNLHIYKKTASLMARCCKALCDSPCSPAAPQVSASASAWPRACYGFLKRQCRVDLPLLLEQSFDVVPVVLLRDKEVRRVHSMEDQSNNSMRIRICNVLVRLAPSTFDRGGSAMRVWARISDLQHRGKILAAVIHSSVDHVVAAKVNSLREMVVYAFQCKTSA